MNVIELSQRIQFVTNAEGHRSAGILSLDNWEKLLTLLEDLEDAEEIRRAREDTEDTIPWEQVKAELDIES